MNKGNEQIFYFSRDVINGDFFCLQDAITDKYYCLHKMDYNRPSEWSVIMADNFTEVRRWSSFGATLESLLEYSGFYQGLIDLENEPRLFSNNLKQTLNIPDSWLIVKYDSSAQIALERVAAQQLLAQAWRLRPITANYGDAARKIYQAIEKEQTISQYSNVVIFKVFEKGYVNANLVYHEAEKLKNFLNIIGKTEIKTDYGKTDFVVAVKTQEEAIEIKFRYEGQHNCSIVDFQELVRLVNP